MDRRPRERRHPVAGLDPQANEGMGKPLYPLKGFGIGGAVHHAFDSESDDR